VHNGTLVREGKKKGPPRKRHDCDARDHRERQRWARGGCLKRRWRGKNEEKKHLAEGGGGYPLKPRMELEMENANFFGERGDP